MTAMTLFNGNSAVPAHIAARGLSANTLALAGNAPQGKRISIEGGVFRLIAGGKEIAKNKNREMNVIIVRTAPANSRVFYDPSVPYQRGQATPPDCSSADGVRPDPRVKNKQADTCDRCPQNIAGSGNGESRACRYNRRLAVVLDGDLDGDVYQLTLPATSLFGKGAGGTQNLPLEAYARMLASNHCNVDDVVTKMEFDTDASTPKLTFTAVRFLTPEEVAIVERQGATPEAETAVGVTAYQMDTGTRAIAPPVSRKAAPAPVEEEVEEAPASNGFVASEEEEEAPAKPTKKAKPAPVAVDDDEVTEEPVKVTKPAPKDSNISNVLAAWGD